MSDLERGVYGGWWPNQTAGLAGYTVNDAGDSVYVDDGNDYILPHHRDVLATEDNTDPATWAAYQDLTRSGAAGGWSSQDIATEIQKWATFGIKAIAPLVSGDCPTGTVRAGGSCVPVRQQTAGPAASGASAQWIAGVDNKTVMLAGAGIVLLLIIAGSGGGGRRR